jgi:hypothetical protein
VLPLFCAQLGVGLRSNVAAARQLMDQDLLGTSRFAVVRDDFDRNQVRSRFYKFKFCKNLDLKSGKIEMISIVTR